MPVQVSSCPDCDIVPSGDTLANYPERLLEFDNFMTRDCCGDWIPEIQSIHFWGDLLFAGAYMTIPVTILVAFLIWRVSIFPNVWIAIGFSMFIALCGVDHMLSAASFYLGIYDLQAITKGAGSIVSVAVAISIMWWTVLMYKRHIANQLVLLKAKALETLMADVESAIVESTVQIASEESVETLGDVAHVARHTQTMSALRDVANLVSEVRQKLKSEG